MSKGLSKLIAKRRFQKIPEGYILEDELEVSPGDVLDTNVGPVVVVDTDEETGNLVIANTEDDTLIISAEEFAAVEPVQIELTPEEVYALVDEESEDDDSDDDSDDE